MDDVTNAEMLQLLRDGNLSVCAQALFAEYIDAELARLTTLEAERDELREALRMADDAIRWALGEGDSDFGDNLPREAPRYWWRKVLREKAGLAWNYGARLSLRATYHTKGEER